MITAQEITEVTWILHYKQNLNLKPANPGKAPFQLAIFTDGSCTHDNNPQAGWGFTVSNPVDPLNASNLDIDGFGPMELPRDIPASVPTNNLAEIQAVTKLLIGS